MLGPGTTLLVDTYDVPDAIETAVALAGPDLGAIRIDSGDLAQVAREARAQLDALGAPKTRIILTGDLDEFSIAALAAQPVDGYGVGHLARHRVRRADRRARLQAGRTGRG